MLPNREEKQIEEMIEQLKKINSGPETKDTSLLDKIIGYPTFGKNLDLVEIFYRTAHDKVKFSEEKDRLKYLHSALSAAEKYKNEHVHSGHLFDPQQTTLSTNKFIFHIQLIYGKSHFTFSNYPDDMQQYISQTIFSSQNVKTIHLTLMAKKHAPIKSTDDNIRIDLMGDRRDGFDRRSGLRETVNLHTAIYY